VVVCIHNPSTQKTEARELQIQGQPGLKSETLSPEKQNKATNEKIQR
jgi:hypothetical protein